jgi:adenosine deaminase
MTIAPTPAAPMTPSMPMVLLHEHLDGGLRPQTLLELCRERGLRPPAEDAAALAAWVQANANSGSLGRYLAGFQLTVEAMASLAACERVAFEAAEDARADGCVLAEFRIAPLLLEPFGLAGDAVVEALLAGLARSPLRCGLIVCAMRHEPPAHTLRSALLAARFAGRGVIGFDLAGAEAGHPPGEHAAAFAAARDAGLGLTCHAGEADIGARVLEAAALGATRIGHGIHIVDDEANMERARELGLHFEVCPSSNVHTGASTSLAAHPLKRMRAAGLSVSLSTDNRLMSGVRLSDEWRHARQAMGLDEAALRAMNRAAAAASFLPGEARAALAATLASAPAG